MNYFLKINNYTPFQHFENNTSFYIAALIPARSGSKGLAHKNIKLYKGIPLLAHSIKIAKNCNLIHDVYVSTDSSEYADIAVQYGAKIPDLRPSSISDDLSPDIDTFHHFFNYLRMNNLRIPDIIVHLRPTYPNRSLPILNQTISLFIKNYYSYDSLRTVVPIAKSPYKMYYLDEHRLIPFIKEYKDFNEPYNQARQNFPTAYLHNGCIDIIKTNIIIQKNKLSGDPILPFIMDEHETDDIDEEKDFNNAENKII
jgi:N-acylneuraminate cytidylyltransferase